MRRPAPPHGQHQGRPVELPQDRWIGLVPPGNQTDAELLAPPDLYLCPLQGGLFAHALDQPWWQTELSPSVGGAVPPLAADPEAPCQGQLIPERPPGEV